MRARRKRPGQVNRGEMLKRLTVGNNRVSLYVAYSNGVAAATFAPISKRTYRQFLAEFEQATEGSLDREKSLPTDLWTGVAS